MQELYRDDLPELSRRVITADGEDLGYPDKAFYNDDTGRVEYVGVKTGWFSTRYAPLRGARVEDDRVVLAYTKDQLKDAPEFAGDELRDKDRQRYDEYYSRYDDEQAMTRKEEELQVGTRPVETGSVRLRKWVETEPVDVDVELRQETARVTRERVDQPVGDHDFEEEEIEVPLRGEEAMVQKQAVAKERVSVGKDVRTDTKTVRDKVRKERVEVEGDVDEKDRR
jgi:uncharacterized protein (TIGR02271 family)